MAAVRFATGAGPSPEPVKWVTVALMSAQSLIYVVPCGLPLAMACRRLSRLGYRRAAWVAGIGLGAVTALASLVAGLLGPVAILIYALVLSVPVWIAAWWLARRN